MNIWRLGVDARTRTLYGVRHVVGLGRVARKSAGLRVRQPLGRMLVVAPGAQEREALMRHQGDLLDELNVKAVELLDS